MTFYVEKKLALGPISFGLSPGRGASAPDDDPSLSTGCAGEFVRRRSEGFFFGGQDRFSGPTLPPTPGIGSKPFWESLKGDSAARTYGFYTLLLVGAIIFLLGILVIARKGPQGWVEVFLGAAVIALPIVLTAQQRRRIREEEERERTEREAQEKRNREMLAAYTTALDRAQSERSDEAFGHLDRERQTLTLPVEVWAPSARRAILLIAFDELSKRGASAAADVAKIIDRACRSAGISIEDAVRIRTDVYSTVVWHLLADDRLGPVQAREVAAIREALGAQDATAAVVQQFQRLRGLTPQTLPRTRCSTRVGFQEYCVYETATDQGTLHVTNKNMILDGRKRIEIPIAHAFDVVVNADDSVVSVKTDNPKRPLRLKVEQPVYTAGMLDLAASIDERPRGFA